MLGDWNNDRTRAIPVKLLVTSELRNERIEICKNCEWLTDLKFCSKCMCFMPVKTWLSGRKCPIKKWGS